MIWIIAGGGGALCCAPIGAQTTSWQNPGSGDWFQASNWDAGVPAVGSIAVINNGGEADIAAAGAIADHVLVGTDAAGLLDLTGGSLSVGSFLIGDALGSVGTCSISGGQLFGTGTSLSNGVGNAGTGWWTQSAGDVVLQNNFNVGSASSGVGTASISGGLLQTRTMFVGVLGAGSVLHSGGSVSVVGAPPLAIGNLTLASAAGATGYYRISGDAHLSVRDELRIGRQGSATFEQVGGTVEAQRVLVGMEPGSTGRYVMLGGTLLSAVPFGIGSFDARGSFEQFGGVVRGGIGLRSALPGAEPAATYDLYDGLIELGSADLGLASSGSGAALFRQHGGTVRGAMVSSTVYVVGDTTNRTRYEMSGGSLEAALIYIGQYGTTNPRTAEFLQSAGSVATNTITIANGSWQQSGGNTQTNLLRICFNNNSHASYNLTGGSLSADTILVANDNGGPTGMLSVASATLTTRLLRVGHSVNPFQGQLHVTAPDASITVTEELSFAGNAVFSAVPGATIHLPGTRFDNRATDAGAMAGLNNLTMMFEGAIGAGDDFEVASRNLGPNFVGFDENFAIAGLTIGGTQFLLRLVDEFDNWNDGSANEHLYVRNLVIGPNSIFDLNGRKVYYLNASIDPSATIFFGGGGELIAVPEPGAGVLVVIGSVLASAFRCSHRPNRRRRTSVSAAPARSVRPAGSGMTTKL